MAQLTNISRIDQCSFSHPYVYRDGKADEHFIAFDELEGAGAEDYFNLLKRKLWKVGVDMADCRFQEYDSESNMSDHFSGLQASVEEISGETATYTHCCAYVLDLILCGVAKNSSHESKLFFWHFTSF